MAKKRKRKSRIERIDNILIKIIDRQPLNKSLTDNPKFIKIMKERDKELGI